MSKYNDIADYLVIGFICLLAVAMVYAVVDSASSATVYEHRGEITESPKIPDCDKELWLRIKDRCK